MATRFPGLRSRTLHGLSFVALLLLWPGCTTEGPAPPPPDSHGPALFVLGSPPLCEASAAKRAPWDRSVILVADDDVRGCLFSFDLDSDGLLTGQRSLPFLSGDGPDDIEAMAVVGGQVLTVGSHGRSARCEPRPARESLELLAWDAQADGLRRVRFSDSSERMRRAFLSRSTCLEELFVSPPPVLSGELCQALVEAAAALDADLCIPPLDIEGAAALPDETDGNRERVWLGLRRPRLDGHTVLLRLTVGLDELRFDGVSLLPVGDRGIRGLTADRDALWVILGPTSPKWDRSALWRAPASEIAPGSTAGGRIVAEGLPPSSEALILDGSHALVLTDGSAGAVPGRCRHSPLQVRVPLD